MVLLRGILAVVGRRGVPAIGRGLGVVCSGAAVVVVVRRRPALSWGAVHRGGMAGGVVMLARYWRRAARGAPLGMTRRAHAAPRGATKGWMRMVFTEVGASVRIHLGLHGGRKAVTEDVLTWS